MKAAAPKSQAVVMDFMERYFSELKTKDLKTIQTKMADDKVYFRKGSLSDLSQVVDTMPLNISLVDRHYEVMWEKNSIPFITTVFPAQYDLLLGMEKNEAVNKFKDTVLASPQRSAQKSAPTNLRLMADGFYQTNGDTMNLASLTEALYYNKMNDVFQPVFDKAHPDYSAANLFHGLITNSDYRMYVEQSVYGMKTVSYTLSLKQWLNYCTEWGLKVFLPQYYARLVIQPNTENSDRLKQDEIVEKFVMLDDKRLNRESPINTGAFPITLANWKLFQRRLSQVMNPVWLALKKIPNWTESYFIAMTVNRGLPYTEANEYSKFVGEQVSFRTFMTSLLNKRSVIYTEKIGANAGGSVQSKYGIGYHGMYQASSAYYGTVCTGFTSYLIGLIKIVSSGVWGTVSGMEPIARGYYDSNDESTRWQLYQNGNYVACTKDDVWEAMKTMDFIWNTGHCSVISDIYSDEYGDKELVVWTEQTTPRGKMTPFSKEGILNRLLLITETENTDSDSMNSHKYWVLYRYSNWANMGSNAVNFEEDADTPYIQTKFSDYSPKPLSIDPDIQICLGDYPAIAITDGAFQQTIPFCFNVHRDGKYTTLQIFNESDNAESSNPVATIDISSNVSGQIYNSTDIESDDADDKDDWIVVDMRNITLGTTLTSGKYKARVTDNTETSGFTHFELVDISEFSYNPQTTTVEFSTESGTPYLVRLETNAGLARGSWDLTQQDISNGSKVLTGINPTTDNHILKIFVKADYGVVTKTIDLNQ
jgi:hypothetical protein